MNAIALNQHVSRPQKCPVEREGAVGNKRQQKGRRCLRCGYLKIGLDHDRATTTSEAYCRLKSENQHSHWPAFPRHQVGDTRKKYADKMKADWKEIKEHIKFEDDGEFDGWT